MRTRITRLLAVCLMILISSTRLQADVLHRAETLILEGSPGAALSILSDYQPATPEAEIRLLWARAVAHMRLRQPSAALGHLERLVALKPLVPEYRLELAAALGQLNQSERALYHIEIARSAGLPEQIDQRVAAYAQQLENPKIVTGHFSFAIVPESNPGKRTSATEVILFGLPFQINPNARAQPATGLELNAGVAATPQLAPGWRAQIGFSSRFRLYDGKAPDDYSGRVFASVIHGFLETGQTHIQIFTSRRWLDKRYYSRSLGYSLSHARRVTPSTRVTAAVTRETTTYRNGAQVDRNFAALGVAHIVNPQLELSLAARAEDRNSDISALAGQLHGVSLGGQYRFSGGLQVSLTFDYERNRFEGLHPLMGIPREDRRSSARLDFSNSQWNWNGFAPVLRISAERQKSTVVINDFRNIAASLGATRRF